MAPPADFSELELEGLARLGALYSEQSLTPEKVCRPFDKAHCGFVFGEGAGCLILATEEVAKKISFKSTCLRCWWVLGLRWSSSDSA